MTAWILTCMSLRRLLLVCVVCVCPKGCPIFPDCHCHMWVLCPLYGHCHAFCVLHIQSTLTKWIIRLKATVGLDWTFNCLMLDIWTLVIIGPQVSGLFDTLFLSKNCRPVFQPVLSCLFFTSFHLYFCEWCKQGTKWISVEGSVFHWPNYLSRGHDYIC